MQKKTIKSYLNSRIDSWLNTVKDPSLVGMIKRDCIVTGGAIASMLMNEPVNDVDVYFRTKETAKAVAEYYCKLWIEKHPDTAFKPKVVDNDDIIKHHKDRAAALGKEYEPIKLEPGRIKMVVRNMGIVQEEPLPVTPVENLLDQGLDIEDDIAPEQTLIDDSDKDDKDDKDDYRPLCISPNAISLKGKVQLIIRFYGEVEEIHKNYDFVHCTNAWEYFGNKLKLRQDALEAILEKRLYYIGSKYPLCSVIRTRKFIKRGWSINAGQYLKMLFQVSQLDLTDIAVLEDQLVGVDSAYFQSLISRMQDDSTKSEDAFNMDSDYVSKVVDQIFGDDD